MIWNAPNPLVPTFRLSGAEVSSGDTPPNAPALTRDRYGVETGPADRVATPGLTPSNPPGRFSHRLTDASRARAEDVDLSARRLGRPPPPEELVDRAAASVASEAGQGRP